MSRAKESFLERLKREREEAQKPQTSQAADHYQEEYEAYQETYHPLPRIEKEVSSDESSSEEEEEIPQPVKKVAPKQPAGRYSVSIIMRSRSAVLTLCFQMSLTLQIF